MLTFFIICGTLTVLSILAIVIGHVRGHFESAFFGWAGLILCVTIGWLGLGLELTVKTTQEDVSVEVMVGDYAIYCLHDGVIVFTVYNILGIEETEITHVTLSHIKSYSPYGKQTGEEWKWLPTR